MLRRRSGIWDAGWNTNWKSESLSVGVIFWLRLWFLSGLQNLNGWGSRHVPFKRDYQAASFTFGRLGQHRFFFVGKFGETYNVCPYLAVVFRGVSVFALCLLRWNNVRCFLPIPSSFSLVPASSSVLLSLLVSVSLTIGALQLDICAFAEEYLWKQKTIISVT